MEHFHVRLTARQGRPPPPPFQPRRRARSRLVDRQTIKSLKQAIHSVKRYPSHVPAHKDLRAEGRVLVIDALVWIVNCMVASSGATCRTHRTLDTKHIISLNEAENNVPAGTN